MKGEDGSEQPQVVAVKQMQINEDDISAFYEFQHEILIMRYVKIQIITKNCELITNIVNYGMKTLFSYTELQKHHSEWLWNTYLNQTCMQFWREIQMIFP